MITKVPATDEDKEFARCVHHQAYKDVVIRQFGQWDENIQDEFFFNDWTKSIFEIVKYNNQSIGYYGYQFNYKVFHIMEIVIHPDYQCKGIGSEIIQAEIKKALSKHLVIRLQTLHCNHAKRLYIRLGFVEYEKSTTHVLMEYKQS